MAVNWPLTTTTTIRQRNLIKLPEAFLMTNGLGKKDSVNVTIGKTFGCVIITPLDAQQSDRTSQRINILTNEPLNTNR